MLFSVSPLVDEDKLAVDGVSGDVLGGLHPDVCQAGLGDDVGVQAADGYQAAQVAALVVGLVVLVESHLGGWPALQVACAVDGAEALTVRCNEGRSGETVLEVIIETIWEHLSGIPAPCCGDDGRVLQLSELDLKAATLIHDYKTGSVWLTILDHIIKQD